jgi:hypothetical protein
MSGRKMEYKALTDQFWTREGSCSKCMRTVLLTPRAKVHPLFRTLEDTTQFRAWLIHIDSAMPVGREGCEH